VLLASFTSSLTSFIGSHGIYAVFVLMLVAAVLPAASEVTMLYAGAVAAGAFAGTHVSVFGAHVTSRAGAYVALAVAGVVGNAVGCVIGWAIGDYGGRPFLERHGRWLHVTPARMDRAERWFDRFGPFAVLLGLMTPLVRSFIAIPAGIAGMPLRRFLPLATLGCIPFCFGLAAGGWALGRSWESAHHDLTYVGVAAVVVVLVLLVVATLRLRPRRPRVSS
jgi:membrane protein DedA with SNARE-associated domain